MSIQLEKAAASSTINHDRDIQGGNAAIVAHAVNQQGFFQQILGHFDLAERSFLRALALDRKILPERHLTIAAVLNNLAFIYMNTGRDEQAEKLFKKSIAIRQELLPSSHPIIAASLNNLAQIYAGQGRQDKAILLQRQVLKTRRKALRKYDPFIAESLQNLAGSLEHQGKYVKAQSLLEEALAIRKRSQARNHPETAGVLNRLAQNLYRQKKYKKADRFFRQTLTMRHKSQPAGHVDIASTFSDRADNLYQLGKFSRAARFYGKALAIYRKAYSTNHPVIATTLAGMAETVLAQGQRTKALELIRQAVKIDSSHRRIKPKARQHFTQLVEIGWRVSRLKHGRQDRRLMDETLVAGQMALQTTASAAVAKMSARFAASQPALQKRIRQLDELEVKRTKGENELIKAFANPASFKAARKIRRKLRDIERQTKSLVKEIRRRFPAYFSLVRPAPLKTADIQKLLHTDEGFLKFFPGNDEVFVWAITKHRAVWQRLPLTIRQLDKDIRALRQPLAAPKKRDVNWFDLDLSYRLFTKLLKPVYPLLRNKSKLIVTVSGELTALPLQLLITHTKHRTRSARNDRGNRFHSYQQAQWLVRSHAISVIPSASSLKSIRQLAARSKAPKALIGFGDPVFSPKLEAQQKISQLTTQKVITNKGYSDYWSGKEIDYDLLRRALPRLKGTADELKAVAQALQISSSDILLREKASEANVKRLDLSQYRILYFATHGLVAGLIRGQGEPSLALTIPQKPDARDNGLLTSSEVAQLDLDADWVVLSACNTAAGSKPGAEALSGLARAFFFAGARALLVSHWNISDVGTVGLMTRTFRLLHDEPELPRSVALQRATIDFMNDPDHPEYADPFYWAAFSLIGG